MELLIKINTGEALSLAEAAELAEASRRDRVPLNQLATDFIREGLVRRRGLAAGIPSLRPSTQLPTPHGR